MADASFSPSSSPKVAMRRRASYRALGSLSPTSGGFSLSCEPAREEEASHFLDACALCRGRLGRTRDVFMYRGDTPFCSEQSRQDQMELDEAREEEDAGYWWSRRRRSHRVRAPGKVAEDVQSIPARAAVAG